MWLKIECHLNHESTRINANSNPGSGRRGDLVSASSPSQSFRNFRSHEKRFSVRVAVERHEGSHAPSEKVSALLYWRRRQEGPPEGGAGRLIKDSRPADQRCVAPGGRAQC